MLGELADPRGRADGFIDRFLMAYPDPLPVADWSDRGIPEDVADDWRSLIARLWMRPLDVKDGRPVPHVASFTPEGEARWMERYNAHSAEMNAMDFPPSLRGPWGKLREYAGRLTLILTLMHHAADPTADPLMVPSVGPRRVDDAWRLVALLQEPCPPSPRRHRVRPRHGRDASGQGDRRLDSRRTASVVLGTRHQAGPAMDRAMRTWRTLWSYLTGRHAIRPRPAPQAGPKGGRPPSPSYDVHPDLADGHIPGFESSEGFE